MMGFGESLFSRGLMSVLLAAFIKVWLVFPLECEIYKFTIDETHFWRLDTKSYVVSLPTKRKNNKMREPEDTVMSVWNPVLQMPLTTYWSYTADVVDISGWDKKQSVRPSTNPNNQDTKVSKHVSRYVHTSGDAILFFGEQPIGKVTGRHSERIHFAVGGSDAQGKSKTEIVNTALAGSKQVPIHETEDVQAKIETSKDMHTGIQNV